MPDWILTTVIFLVACFFTVAAINLWKESWPNLQENLLPKFVVLAIALFLHYQAFLLYKDTLFALVIFVAVMFALLATAGLTLTLAKNVLGKLSKWLRS